MMTPLLLALAAVAAATDVLESISFASYTGNGLSPTAAGGALNSTLWRVDLVQDTNNDNLYGATKTPSQGAELGRGLQPAGGPFLSGIGAVNINATTRALFLQPASSILTPGFVEFRTKYSSNTSANSLIDVTVEIYFWHLNNGPRNSTWKIGFYSGDVPAAAVDSTDDRVWTTPAASASSPQWTLEKVEFVFLVQYTTGDDFLFVRIAGDDAVGTSGERDTIAISAITVLASKASGTPAPNTPAATTTTTTTVPGGTPAPATTTTTAVTQPGDTTTTTATTTTAVTQPGDTTTTTATTTTTVAGGSTTSTVLVTGTPSASGVASLAALVATVAAMAMMTL